MAFASNSPRGNIPTSFSRHKATQLKLLELLRSEKPSLHVVTLPSQPVQCGRNRLKFPDKSNDWSVTLTLSGQTARVSLPVHYKLEKTEEVELEEDECPHEVHLHGLWYSIQIDSVTRYSLHGGELSSNLPEKSYCCYPLSKQRRCDQSEPGGSDVYGFWFRFFDEETRYHFHVVLKLEGVELFPKEFFKNDPYLTNVIDENGVVCSVDFDICTKRDSSKAEKKSQSVLLPKATTTATPTLHLYSNEKYKTFIKSVQELKFESKSDELEKLLSNASTKYQTDYDIKVVVLLEQGLVACRKRFCDYAKELFRNAVDLVGRCRNKALLTGRIYVCLSEVHFNEGFIGNAGESLNIARKYIETFGLCEDLGDLCFCEGLILMVYAKRTQAFLKSLIPEAREKFLEAARNFSQGESVSDMADKVSCTYVKLASLELQPMPINDTKELEVTPEQVSKAQSYLEKAEQTFDLLSLQTKVYYNLCSAELYLVINQMEKAKEMFNKASELAKSVGLQSFVHVDLALEEVKRCLEIEDASSCKEIQIIVSDEKPPTKNSLADKSDNDGYLGDRSDEDT